MDERVFEALREKVKSEPYAKMLGLELVKVASSQSPSYFFHRQMQQPVTSCGSQSRCE